MNWFLSHKQKTGQRISLSLHSELIKIGETAFLDVKTELELHDLEKIVQLCDFFVFIYSDGIFDSEYCRNGNNKRRALSLILCRVGVRCQSKEANCCSSRCF